MSGIARNSREVTSFLALFARLRGHVGTPGRVADMAEANSEVRDLCAELSMAAHWLEMNERRRRSLFASPVDPAFIEAWRDYQEHYASGVSAVWLSELFTDIEAAERPPIPKAELDWINADNEACEQARGIEDAIQFAQANAAQEERWIDHPEFIEAIQEGIAAWEGLKQALGFDLRAVFRRRALVPFVLVPRHVAAKHGTSEAHSLLNHLQQAHDAFVFGSTRAALALMRSIMETVLRDHYQVDGKDLHERISNARSKLPRGANEAALHRLRKLANAILHFDRKKDQSLAPSDGVQLEKEIVLLLFVLRALIEGAP